MKWNDTDDWVGEYIRVGNIYADYYETYHCWTVRIVVNSLCDLKEFKSAEECKEYIETYLKEHNLEYFLNGLETN